MNFRETLKSIGIIPVIQINDAEKQCRWRWR